MRVSIRGMVLAMAAVAACSGNPADGTAGSDVAIVQGMSYGMCVGYCWSELVVEGNSAVLMETSRDSVRYPRRTRSIEITSAQWQRIQSLAETSVMSEVEGTHGCPDCADGGAEWVELRMGGRAVRATYEAGRDLAPIASLQAELRSIRQRFQ